MEKLAIGRIRSSHGIKGYLKIVSFSGETDHYFELEEILLKNKGRKKTFRIEDVKSFGSSVLLKLEGVDTPEEGKRYSGWEIWVDRKYAAPLKHGEFYIRDMIGCSILFNGSVVGTVKGVTDSSADDLLEIKTGSGMYFVPFRNEFIGEVDIEKGTIVLLNDGLLS